MRPDDVARYVEVRNKRSWLAPHAARRESWLVDWPKLGNMIELESGTGRAYPSARVHAIDLDEASVAEALRNAEQAKLADGVRFDCCDVGHAGLPGQYDLVMLFETLHDMADPVSVLRAALAVLVPGGAVLVGDEEGAETFSAPGDKLERFNYGWSALHCLPAALTEPNSVATGTVIRPATVQGFAEEAGFSTVTVLPIAHEFWRFYRLDS